MHICFIWLISLVWASTIFETCFRPHNTAIACENVEGISLKQSQKKRKKRENVGYLQSAETIDKAPICNTFVILSQTPFLGKEDDDDNKIK